MITATINGKKYQIPTAWRDVKYGQVIKFFTHKQTNQFVCDITGIEPEVLEKLSVRSVESLFKTIEFTNDFSIFDNKTPSEKWANYDFGRESYQKAEKAREIINANMNKSWYEAMPEVIKLLTEEDILDKPVTKVIGDVNFFFLQLIPFLTGTGDYQKENQNQKKFSLGSIGLRASEHLELSLASPVE